MLVLVVGLHAFVYGRYLPSAGGHIGHDYGYAFPHLLAGAYWFHQNGPFSIPWFTPALAGGMPFYAHPLDGYFSFPQAAMIAGGPIFAARATLVVFAALGFLGTYSCLRRAFGLSLAASLLGATLFTWNGFFTARMLAGHLGFHSQMLVPLAAYWITRPVPDGTRARRIVFDALCAGLVFTYMFQAGNFYGLVPAALACAAIAICVALRGGRIADSGMRLALAIVVVIPLCAAKLNAALAFVDACPRAGYPLPGAFNEAAAVLLAAQSLFVFPSVELGRAALVNQQFRLDRHELDYDITWVALVLVLVAAWTFRHRIRVLVRGKRNIALVACAFAVLLVPILVNVYSPHWNEFLKHVPIVRNSSNLVRWFVAYVPVFCVLAALGFDALCSSSRRSTTLAIAAGVLVVVTHVCRDRSYYANQPYSVARIENAWRELRATDRVPPIDRCGGEIGADKDDPWPADRNDHLLDGESRIACYEPMFGYQLEWLPVLTLHAGPARARQGDTYNFKNPAGYVFPAENGLRAGDHFHAGQEAELDAFLDYRPFAFEKSARQKAAEVVNLCALAAALSGLAALALVARRTA